MFALAALLLFAMTPLSVCLLCAIVLPLYFLFADVNPIHRRLPVTAPQVRHVRLQELHSPRPPPTSW